ncbi:MAG: cell division protein FtsI [Acetatifactor sp.]|nr:cell division protein FtsI [Acetatifactor sp.]
MLAQQQYDSTTLPYRRGDIVDAKGTVIATSEKVYNLIIDAKVMNTQIGGKTPYLEPTLTALGQYFDLDMGAIREHVATNKNSAWYVARKQLSYEEISGFKAAQKENANIKGVWFEEEYKRIYPYGSMAADVIGFSNMDNQGSYGLEEYYSDVLNGVNGREYGYVNDDLALERTVKAALDGNNLHSTIDANVQLIVEKYLKKFMEEHKDEYHPGNGAENVGCVIQWVDTGEILAMASYPTYDLNDVRDPQALIGSMMVEQVDIGNGYYEIKKSGKVIDQAVLDAMSEDELYLNLNNLWKNYCITGTYEPGSVAKPFTVAAALETGVIAPNSTFECTGFMEIGGYKIKCHSSMRGTHTLEQAIATSCNVSMMKIAQTLGTEDFCEFQSIFNFGLRTNIDLAGEARTASLIYTADRMGPTDLATNSFGQNFNVTMIQTITAFSSLINGGYYYEPHMVSKITNAAGATVENIEPRVLKQTISESTSAYIRQYCRAVVESGTGKTARPAGYMIGGKTGTAETIDPNTHKRSEDDHVVSFMGYAPADDPKIAIYVVVDRPNVEKQGNARFATGIVRNILTEVLPYLNIFMTEELSETEKQELEALNLEITAQYTARPEGQGGQSQDPNGNAENQLPWQSFPVDPESGYRVDPATGYKYDAQEGFLVESVIGTQEPVNPDIN